MTTITTYRPFTYNVYSPEYPWYGSGGPQTEYLEDRLYAERKPLTRTPRGRWRAPTSYWRYVDEGNVQTYDVTGDDRWGDDVNGHGVITFSGARNASGFFNVNPPVFPSELEDKAITRALSNLKNQKINLAQAFAERGQTTRLVGDTIRRITDVVLDIRRTKRALAHTPEDFFKYFLEVQYGWKPAMQDCYGAVKELHEREQQSARGMATVKANVRENEVIDDWLSDSGNTCVYDFIRRRRITHSGHIRLDYLQSNGAPTGPFSRLGITNPALIAWELTPWSFVADWFVPVGDYLSLLDATIGWDFQGGSFSAKTVVETSTTNFKARPDPSKDPYNRKVSVYGHGKSRRVRFNRSVYSSSPFPNRPHLKTNSSGVHVANGIALLMAAITGARGVR